MDITPQVLKEVKFTERMRGYDRDEVDEFLERVGAGVAQVQSRVREALERADAAEARAMALGNRSEAEETLKRTLVLAQRTADAAVAEANETAARTTSEAEARAARTVADAEAHAAVLRAEAETEVRRVIESTRAPLVEEIKELEQLRNFLHDDIQLLEGHLASQRERLRAQVADLQRLIDDPGMLEIEPTPATSGVDPEPALPPSEPTPPVAMTPPPTPAPPVVPIEEPPPVHETAISASVWPEIDRPTPVAAPDANDSGPHDVVRDDLSDDPRGDDPPPHWGGTSPEFSSSHEYEMPNFDPPGYSGSRFDDGPPTQQVRSLAELESGGDSFLDQLRRAVDDGPDEDGAMTAFFDQDDDDRPKSRFGRRR